MSIIGESRGIIDDYRSIIDYSRSTNVVIIMIISDNTTWSVTYDPHSYNYNIFITQAK
jgi:hypothetical protein